MAARPADEQIGNTDQLSQNRGGLRSFSDPNEISKGGGSIMDDADFGSSAAFDRRDANRTEINRQIQINKKKERAVRVGYRKALQRGDGRAALALLEDAETQGVNPFGIRQAGDNARQAFGQIQGRRQAEIRGGMRDFDPGRDRFQQGMVADEGVQQRIDEQRDRDFMRDLVQGNEDVEEETRFGLPRLAESDFTPDLDLSKFTVPGDDPTDLSHLVQGKPGEIKSKITAAAKSLLERFLPQAT